MFYSGLILSFFSIVWYFTSNRTQIPVAQLVKIIRSFSIIRPIIFIGLSIGIATSIYLQGLGIGVFYSLLIIMLTLSIMVAITPLFLGKQNACK